MLYYTSVLQVADQVLGLLLGALIVPIQLVYVALPAGVALPQTAGSGASVLPEQQQPPGLRVRITRLPVQVGSGRLGIQPPG